MTRRRTPKEPEDWLFPNVTTGDGGEQPSSLLDVLDNTLNRGALLTGDVILGVADVDLIYVKLSVLLAAFDKVVKSDPAFRPVAAGPPKFPRQQTRPRRRRRTGAKNARR
jgi:Gas vesicle protein